MGTKELLEKAGRTQNPTVFKIYPFLKLFKTVKCSYLLESSYYLLAASYNPQTAELDRETLSRAKEALRKCAELDKQFEQLLQLFEDDDFIPDIWKFLFQTDLPRFRITHPHSSAAEYYSIIIKRFPNFNKDLAKALGIYSALGEKYIGVAKKLL